MKRRNGSERWARVFQTPVFAASPRSAAPLHFQTAVRLSTGNSRTPHTMKAGWISRGLGNKLIANSFQIGSVSLISLLGSSAAGLTQARITLNFAFVCNFLVDYSRMEDFNDKLIRHQFCRSFFTVTFVGLSYVQGMVSPRQSPGQRHLKREVKASECFVTTELAKQVFQHPDGEACSTGLSLCVVFSPKLVAANSS